MTNALAHWLEKKGFYVCIFIGTIGCCMPLLSMKETTIRISAIQLVVGMFCTFFGVFQILFCLHRFAPEQELINLDDSSHYCFGECGSRRCICNSKRKNIISTLCAAYCFFAAGIAMHAANQISWA